MPKHKIPRATGQRLLLLLLAIVATPVLADAPDTPDAVASVAAPFASNAPNIRNTSPDSPPSPQSATSRGFGIPIAPTGLDAARGGSDLGVRVLPGAIFTAGTVSDNRATDVATGSNTIRDGAFASSSGIPVVIQNSGANVLIQSATIVNVQLH